MQATVAEAVAILAQVAPIRPRVVPATGPGSPTPSYLITGLIAVVLIVGVVVVYYLRRNAIEDEPDEEEDLLAEFERAYYSGEMEEAEFIRVRESLQRRGLAPPTPFKPRMKRPMNPAEEAGPESLDAVHSVAEAAVEATPEGGGEAPPGVIPAESEPVEKHEEQASE